MREDTITRDWIYSSDPNNKNGKSIVTSTPSGKTILQAKRTLLFKVNQEHLVCATANFYDADTVNDYILNEEHTVPYNR